MFTMKFSNILFVFGLILVSSCISLAKDNKSYLEPYLNKKYILSYSDENFDEVMKALGVGFFKRNMGKIATPVIKLTEQDGEYTLTSDSIFKNIETKFRIGEKFDDETPDGRKVESIFTQDKNILTQVQNGDETTTIVREFTPEEVKVMQSYQQQSVGGGRAGVHVSSALGALTVLFALALAAQYKWRRRRLEKLASQLPGPPALPILGNGLEFLGDPQEVMSKIVTLCSRYETPFRVWIGPILLIVVSKPDDLQIVLNSSKTLEKDALYRFFRNTVGTGLFSAPVDKWRRNRRAITPAFNARLLEQFVPVFNQQNRVLVGKLAKMAGGKEFDVWDYVSPATLDIICQTALGVDVKAQDDPESEFALALPRASELDYMRIYKFWLHPDFIFNRVSYAKELKKVYKQLHGLPNAVIQQKKEEYRLKKEEALKSPKNEEDTTDEYQGEKKLKVFLDILLELKDAGTNFSDDDLRDEVVTMMVGGSETSALTNSFCLLMLAMHQDVQNKVYEEVYSIFGDTDREVTVEDLNQMVYLEMVLKETLRRFPVGPLFLRQVKEDIELTNYMLPAGCSVVVAPIATHMNPSLYPNPEQFNPENFSPEAVAQRHRYSYIPFSGGPRGCIGSKYAMMSMKTTISTILRSYKLNTTVKMEDIKLKVDLLMRSVDGFKMSLERRSSF